MGGITHGWIAGAFTTAQTILFLFRYFEFNRRKLRSLVGAITKRLVF